MKQSFKLQGRVLALLICLCTSQMLFAHIPPNVLATDAPCNEKTPWVNGTYTNLSAGKSNSGICVLPTSSGTSNLVDATTTNFATFGLTGIGCGITYSVVDGDAADTYPGGYYAGYKISSVGLLSASIGSTVRVETWNNGSFVEGKDVVTSLVGIDASLLDGSGLVTVGFITTLPFDEIRIKYTSLVGVLFTGQVYYPVIEKFCAGPSLDCNKQTLMNNPDYPTFIETSHTGISGLVCAACSVNNAENAISSSTADYATITLAAAIGTTGSIAVKDALTDYPIGTLAGFNISNNNLVGVNALSGIIVRTYLDGTLQETSTSGTLLSINSSLLGGSGDQLVGFISTKSFDEVRLELTNVLGVLNTTNVYNAVFENFCDGPALVCNTLTTIGAPTFPVVVDGANTGIGGIVAVGCSVTNTNNAIDTSASTYSSIVMIASVGTTGSIAVKDVKTDYPAGTYAGFDIENTALLDVSLANAITISTYLNGSWQESKTGTIELIAANTSLLTSDGKRTLGFITTKAFDEVKITIDGGIVGVSLGETKIYRAIFEKFCAVSLECNKTYWLNSPQFPVIIDGTLTGKTGVACVACSVTDAPNVITASATDYATITTVAGVLSSGSIAVLDPVSTYPAGSTVGFAIKDLNNIVQLDLFNSLTICTYNNGAPQECRSGLNLVNLTVLVDLLGSGGGNYNVGFKTTLPYDEVRISVGSLASVINVIRVYGAYVDTRGAIGGGLSCPAVTFNPDINAGLVNSTIPGNVNTNDVVPTGTTYGTPLASGTNPSGATINMNADGSYTFIATQPGVYTYDVPVCVPGQAAPCPTQPLVITVTNPAVTINPPVVNTDIATTAFNTPVTVIILANDGPGNTGGSLGTPTIISGVNAGATAVINSDKTLTYTPAPGFIGKDTITYQVCESPSGICKTADVIITVLPNGAVNTTSAADDYVSTTGTTPATGNVKTNDTDAEGNTQTVATQNVTILGKGTFVLNADGTYTFTAVAGFSGTVNLPYSTCDNGTPQACASASLHVVVKPVEVKLNPDVNAGLVNTTIRGNVNTNDVVPAGTTYGTPLAAGGNPAGAIINMNADGSYTFVATLPGVYTYNVPVCVPGQTAPCPTQPLVITVTNPAGTTNPPVVNTDIATTAFNTPVTVVILSNDGPGNINGVLGTPAIISGVNVGASATINPDNTLTYIPAPGFIGKDTVIYQVCEIPSGICKTANVIITVLPNGAINTTAAADDYVSTIGITPATGNVKTNDTDPEGNTQTVATQNITIPGTGVFVLNADGTYIFTAVTNFSGTVNLPYTTCDNGTPLACASASLHVVVQPGVIQGPLPVNLVSFYGVTDKCNARINWSSATEINVKFYELQYSKNETDYKTISTVSARGDNSTYSEIYEPGNGYASYRLKITDKNGNVTFSKIVHMETNCNSNITMVVYPNPVAEKANIKMNNNILVGTKVTLSDANGKLINEKILNNSLEFFDLSSLPSGVYFLRFADGTVKKLIKKKLN